MTRLSFMILLGLHYIGLLDEFSCFNRALSPEEVKTVYEMKGGLASLLKEINDHSTPGRIR